MWRTVEAHWRAPFAEALLIGLTTPVGLYKHCVRGDVLFLEIMYRSWLHKHHRHQRQPERSPPPMAADGAPASATASTTAPAAASGRRAYRFANSTALIEAVMPRAARPIGFSYKPALLPSAIDAKWYHPAPASLSRLWLYAASDDGALAAEATKALGQLYAHPAAPPSSSAGFLGSGGSILSSSPLVAWRFPFDLNWANASHRGCATLERLGAMGAPAAAMLLSSALPRWLWHECGAALRALGVGHAVHGGGGGADEKQGSEEPPTPKYWKHLGEWTPDY